MTSPGTASKRRCAGACPRRSASGARRRRAREDPRADRRPPAAALAAQRRRRRPRRRPGAGPGAGTGLAMDLAPGRPRCPRRWAARCPGCRGRRGTRLRRLPRPGEPALAGPARSPRTAPSVATWLAPADRRAGRDPAPSPASRSACSPSGRRSVRRATPSFSGGGPSGTRAGRRHRRQWLAEQQQNGSPSDEGADPDQARSATRGASADLVQRCSLSGARPRQRPAPQPSRRNVTSVVAASVQTEQSAPGATSATCASVLQAELLVQSLTTSTRPSPSPRPPPRPARRRPRSVTPTPATSGPPPTTSASPSVGAASPTPTTWPTPITGSPNPDGRRRVAATTRPRARPTPAERRGPRRRGRQYGHRRVDAFLVDLPAAGARVGCRAGCRGRGAAVRRRGRRCC